MIVRTVYENRQVTVPDDAYTLDGFRRWAASDDYPDCGKVSFFHGEILIDMSPEKIESHNQVKAEVGSVLGPLAKALDIGKYYPDGLWLTNDEADLSTEPDGTFVKWATLETDVARVVPAQEGARDGIELRGSPDWVLEVVSDSSVKKDTEILPASYHRAGIGEFWLIDSRGEELRFAIFHRGPEGFQPIQPDGAWLHSHVFQRDFRLSRSRDRTGGWQYTLEMREA